jgi:fatty-acyl-CoA synthase
VDEELLPSVPGADSLGDVAEVIVISDSGAAMVSGDGRPLTAYEEFRGRGSLEPLPWTVPDEQATISINYTSGTTGDPKGVAYTHRGAYLNSLGRGDSLGALAVISVSLDPADVSL